LGSWNDENRLTNIIESIWSTIDTTTKDKLLNFYIDIYFSDRRDTFEQKQFASKVLHEPEHEQFVRNWIENKIFEEIESNDLKPEDIESEIKYFSRYYSKARRILSYDADEWIEYLSDVYNQKVKK